VERERRGNYACWSGATYIRTKCVSQNCPLDVAGGGGVAVEHQLYSCGTADAAAAAVLSACVGARPRAGADVGLGRPPLLPVTPM
jgi:hypothetical protein